MKFLKLFILNIEVSERIPNNIVSNELSPVCVGTELPVGRSVRRVVGAFAPSRGVKELRPFTLPTQPLPCPRNNSNEDMLHFISTRVCGNWIARKVNSPASVWGIRLTAWRYGVSVLRPSHTSHPFLFCLFLYLSKQIPRPW